MTKQAIIKTDSDGRREVIFTMTDADKAQEFAKRHGATVEPILPTLTASISIADVCLPDFATRGHEAAICLSRFDSLDALREAVRDELNGHDMEWTPAQWAAVDKAIEDDFVEGNVRFLNDIHDEGIAEAKAEGFDEDECEPVYVYLDITVDEDSTAAAA